MDFSFHHDSTQNIGRYFSDFPIFTFVFLASATIVYFGDATAKLVSSFWLIGMKNGIESYNRVHLICWKHFVSLPWRLRIVLLWRQRYQWATVVTSPVSSLISMRWRQTRTNEKRHWSLLLKRWRHWWRQQHHLTTASTSTFGALILFSKVATLSQIITCFYRRGAPETRPTSSTHSLNPPSNIPSLGSRCPPGKAHA